MASRLTDLSKAYSRIQHAFLEAWKPNKPDSREGERSEPKPALPGRGGPAKNKKEWTLYSTILHTINSMETQKVG